MSKNKHLVPLGVLLATLVVSVLGFVYKNKRSKPQLPPAVPKAATTAALVNKVHDPIPALAALYQGEKTDASYLFNTAMAMMGLALAYLLGAILKVPELSHVSFGWLFLLLLPIPLWLVIAFHSLMTLNAMSHGISVQIIEDALFYASELGVIPVQRNLVGSVAGDKIMDINKAMPAHKTTTFVVYGGVALLVFGFTGYAFYSANCALTDNVASYCELLVGIATYLLAAATYSLLMIIVWRSWRVGLKIIEEGRSQCDKYEDYWRKRELMRVGTKDEVK